MVSKRPPEYPSHFQHATVSTVDNVLSTAQAFFGSPDETDPEKIGVFQKEIIHPLKGFGKWLFFDLIPGLQKIGRGTVGTVLAPMMSFAGAFTGIPPTEVNTLVSGLNTAEGTVGIFTKFKELSEKQLQAWRSMTTGQKMTEAGKRLLSVVVNPIIGALSGVFNTGIANILGGVATVAGGLGRLQKKLKNDSSLYPLLEQATPYGKVVDLAGSATQALETVMNTANFWGKVAEGVANSGFGKKILSPERIKLWQAYGNDLLVAASGGDKSKILEMVKSGVMEAGSRFAKRLGASENDLEEIQRLAQGDLGVLNEVVKNFIPGFEVKDAKSLMGFSTTVKQTFTQALTQFTHKYVEGTDFERVSMGMTELLGIKEAGVGNIARRLGDIGKRALGEKFETIRTRGDKMVTAATDFVNKIQDPNVREKMGYTLAAGNTQEALEALVQQKASADFINKIHTFKLIDAEGKEKILDPKALDAFKQQAVIAVTKVTQPATPAVP